MKKIVKYNPLELSKIVEETHKEVGFDFAENYLKNLASDLKERPDMYLSFGPYWWLLKNELIKLGINDFGEDSDIEVVEMLDYKGRDLNCAACYAAQSLSFDSYSTHTNDKTVIGDDGEPFIYRLADDDMELMIIAKAIEYGVLLH